MTPTIGRIVHWYDPTRQLGPYAAIITRVHDHEHPATVEVTIFPPFDPFGEGEYQPVVLEHDPLAQADPSPPMHRPYWVWPSREGA